MENATVTKLALSNCLIINLPESRTDCMIAENGTKACVTCKMVGEFSTGESIDEYSSPGHIVCLALAIITIMVAFCGTFMSCLIITVLRRRNSGKSFEILLSALAYVDLVCVLTCASCVASMTVYFQNWDRGLCTIAVYLVTLLASLLARSASSFMTVAITVERYLVVAFPSSMSHFFTPLKTKLLAGFALILATLFGLLPRSGSAYIGPNRFKEIDGVKHLDYLIYGDSAWAQLWYGTLKGIPARFDFWLPLPLLLIFNGLIYSHVRKFSSRRKELNKKFKRDLRAGQMFLPVVVVLLICNIPPIIFTFVSYSTGVLYLEGFYGLFLTATVNSAANLPIYYLKSPGFRDEARVVLRMWFSCLRESKRKQSREGVLGAGSTTQTVNSSSDTDTNDYSAFSSFRQKIRMSIDYIGGGIFHH